MPAVRTSNPQPAAPEPAPMLVPVGQHKGAKTLSLKRSFTMIGSSASARLYLPSKAVSRCHAAVINTGGGLFVRDLASRTQTRVNGQPVNEADLREGDVLQVGPFTFRFTDPTAPAARPPALPGPPAVLEVEGLDAPLPLKGRAILVGRRENADISLTENSASSAHALVMLLEGRHLIRDLTSRTGTFVNGVKVHEQVLSPGDVVRVGETEFRYMRTDKPAEGAARPKRSASAPPPTAPAPTVTGDNGEIPLAPLDVAPLIESNPAPSPSPVMDPREGSLGPVGSNSGLLAEEGRSPRVADDATPSSGLAAENNESGIRLRGEDSP